VIKAGTLLHHPERNLNAILACRIAQEVRRNLNKLIAGTEYADLPLEKIVAAVAGKADKVALFNNAAQAWNHTFYWHSLKPKGGGEPPAAPTTSMPCSTN